jgi:ABC-type glutathione transport system ATPase component
VSHDLPAMREFCDHGLFLLNGRVKAQGDIDDVIEDYMFGAWAKSAPHPATTGTEVRDVDVLDVLIRDAQGRERTTLQLWEARRHLERLPAQ